MSVMIITPLCAGFFVPMIHRLLGLAFPTSRWLVWAGALTTVSNLVWMGFPVRIEILDMGRVVPAAMFGLWGLSLGAVCLPWTSKRARPVVWLVVGTALFAALLITPLCFANLDSPIYAGIERVVAYVLATWAMTGSLTLLIMGAVLPRCIIVSEPSRRELERFFSGLIPDPALIKASPSASLYD